MYDSVHNSLSNINDEMQEARRLAALGVDNGHSGDAKVEDVQCSDIRTRIRIKHFGWLAQSAEFCVQNIFDSKFKYVFILHRDIALRQIIHFLSNNTYMCYYIISHCDSEFRECGLHE